MTYITQGNRMAFVPPTCEVEDLRPLLADVDADVRPSYSQIGTTLVEHQGFHLKQKNKGLTLRKNRGESLEHRGS